MATAQEVPMQGGLDCFQTGNRIPHVEPGPLLQWLQSSRADSLEDYERRGGLRLLRAIRREGRDAGLQLLDKANVRGRAGGGFPVALKWWQLSQSHERTRYFICHANSFHSGFTKERYLIGVNPYALVESLYIAAYLAGAEQVLFCVSSHASAEEMAAIANAIRRFGDCKTTMELPVGESAPAISIKTVPALYIAGEETALIEALEGKPPQPRKKPHMPTTAGYFGKPTAVSNLESVLQASFALDVGAAEYRRTGTEAAPGTLLFSVTGDVERPGLYELPLGTNLQDVVYKYAQGCLLAQPIKMVFPGGLCSAPVRPDQMNVALDYDSLREAGLDLGSGNVIVVSGKRDLLDVARYLADFYRDESCGKCLPCKDGTYRASLLFRRLKDLDQPGVDWEHKILPPSKRATLPPILNGAPAGISYTDDAQGLDKIINICEFFKHRGDCHFSVEAATVMQTMTNIFREEFELARREAPLAMPAFNTSAL